MTQIEREIEAMDECAYDYTSPEEFQYSKASYRMLQNHHRNQVQYDILSDITVTTINRGIIPATKLRTGDYLRSYEGDVLEVTGSMFYNGNDVIPCRCEDGNTANYSLSYLY